MHTADWVALALEADPHPDRVHVVAQKIMSAAPKVLARPTVSAAPQPVRGAAVMAHSRAFAQPRRRASCLRLPRPPAVSQRTQRMAAKADGMLEDVSNIEVLSAPPRVRAGSYLFHATAAHPLNVQPWSTDAWSACPCVGGRAGGPCAVLPRDVRDHCRGCGEDHQGRLEARADVDGGGFPAQ